jgi:hypothetical protein
MKFIRRGMGGEMRVKEREAFPIPHTGNGSKDSSMVVPNS